MAGRWLMGIILMFVILVLMLPSRDEQSLTRIGSASILACTKELRARVAEQLRADQPVTARFDHSCPDLIASLELDNEGNMVIRGNKHEVTMWLTPIFEDDKLRWSCRGEPPDRISKFCRP